MANDSARPALFTIGHSNRELADFVHLLQTHHINAVADVRSSPYSGRCPQYNRESLKVDLAKASIDYVFLGEELGARRTEPDCYDGDRADYRLIAACEGFQNGLRRLQRGMETRRITLMCAEKDPLDCHRFALICRHLRDDAQIDHIIDEETLEPQDEAEFRLLELYDLPRGDLFNSQEELIEQAYDAHGKKINYVRTVAEDGFENEESE